MNENSRVWVYQSNKEFNNSELNVLDTLLLDFTNTWSAHNQQLKASYEIKYNRFIVLIVDENQAGASGCSIDKSVHLMKEMEQKFNINLFDRFHIAWKDKESVYSASRAEFEALIEKKQINSETIVFNNLVLNYKDYQNNWEIPFKESWHSKIFKLEEAS
ncbi:ABC transporter ATPase [Pedobacter cryophilus]|uniref:ABC transporter ATPase n=2 Tax=Pedobacter cryophilus TaxID=2571271 RepID=A0A4U1BX17_9SPHI|nr:ABC transporter ATPase [Pedobacter cryophilus]